MSFVLGLVIGLTVGLAIIVGFVRSENARSKHRTQLANTIAAFARMTVEDSRKLLAPEYYPSWVLNWLNLQLTKIWPYVNEAASELIKANVEPILEQYRPIVLSSLKFSKFTLGTVAPQFTGISIIEDGGGGITMELEMNWDGNPSIILDVCTRLGVALPVQHGRVLNNQGNGFGRPRSMVPKSSANDEMDCKLLLTKVHTYNDLMKKYIFSAYDLRILRRYTVNLHIGLCSAFATHAAPVLGQWILLFCMQDLLVFCGAIVHMPLFFSFDLFEVKNIGFTGVFRLIFKPLVDEFPCFGAVCVSLREKKKLDFTLKVVGGDISAIPGIAGTIEETIKEAVEDSITWPVRKVIPILPGDYSDLELKPVGVLEVKLVQAKELTNKDIIGKSDPFAQLYVRPLRDRIKSSKTINNQLNPVWNEHFEFVIEDASTQHLVVKILDDEGLQPAELIGYAQIRLSELEPGKIKDVWLKLVKDLELQRDVKNRGQVHLELLYYPYGMENGFPNPFAPSVSMTSLERVFKNSNEAGENGSEMNQKRRDVITRGVLSVTVISAEDLAPTDLMGKADPYVVITMKKTQTKNKTRVVNDNLNPVWNQSFDFLVEDGLHDMLVLEVWDHDTFGKDYMGTCILTLTRVILEGEYKDSIELDGAKSGKLNLHLKWMPQPIYRDS
ncbi:hypothetical protein LguiB_024485 [Lonicera macranthoides]